MRYFSMFSGIGGFELGIQRACDKQFATIKQDRQRRNRNTNQDESDVLPTSRTTPLCVGYSEIDKYAIQIYEKHFPYEECEQCKKNREHLQGSEWGDIRPIGISPALRAGTTNNPKHGGIGSSNSPKIS